MNRKLVNLIILLVLSLQTGCLYIARYDGPYHGKVVDKETREPIEGAVVLGTWYTETPTLAGAIHSYYDAQEAVTNKKGEFTVSGQGLRVMSRLLPVSVVIFKAGYSYYSSGEWNTIKTGLYSKEEVKWEGEMPTFPIKKLTVEERRSHLPPGFPSEAYKAKAIPRWIAELNNEEYQLYGKRPYPED